MLEAGARRICLWLFFLICFNSVLRVIVLCFTYFSWFNNLASLFLFPEIDRIISPDRC